MMFISNRYTLDWLAYLVFTNSSRTSTRLPELVLKVVQQIRANLDRFTSESCVLFVRSPQKKIIQDKLVKVFQ